MLKTEFSAGDADLHGWNQTEMIHEKPSGEIIGAAMAVLNELGPGLEEKSHGRALVIGLRKRGAHGGATKAVSGAPFRRSDWQPSAGPDRRGLVIADPKVVEALAETPIRQMIGCLAITKLKLALLLNFKYSKLQWKRIVREIED